MLEVFRERYRDQDGRMSFEEFCGQKTRTELAFGAIDKNGDGYVSRDGDCDVSSNGSAIGLWPFYALKAVIKQILRHSS